MGCHDFAANRQADTRAFIFLERAKPAEKLENRFMKPRIDTNAVVSDEERLVRISLVGTGAWLGRTVHGADLDSGLRTLIVFHGVADKVCQKLMKSVRIAPEDAVGTKPLDQCARLRMSSPRSA